MTTNLFYIDTTPEGVTIISLKKQIGQGKEGLLQEALLSCFDKNKFNIILDFTDYEKIYANILRVISWASEIVNNQNGRLILIGLNPFNYEKTEAVGLDELVEIVPDIDFALGILRDNA